MVFRAVILCEGDLLQNEDFPQLASLKPLPAPTPVNDVRDFRLPAPANDLIAEVAASAMEPGLMEVISMAAEGPRVSVFDHQGHLRALEAVERDLIELALEHYSGHMSEIARRLGIGRSTLYRKLREYGLDETRFLAEG
jgi:DNA-binding NtrC family response regulator